MDFASIPTNGEWKKKSQVKGKPGIYGVLYGILLESPEVSVRRLLSNLLNSLSLQVHVAWAWG